MSHPDATPRTITADRLSAAFNEIGGQARPDYLPDIVAQAGRTRQRPAWTFLERWLPMDIAVLRQGVPRAVLVFAALALLVALLVATVAFIGSSRSIQPPLTGPTNGLIAYASGDDIVVVEPDGTGRRTLIADARNNGAGMAWSPDGTRLAYWSRVPSYGPWKLIVVDADGGNPVVVASGIGGESASRPAWSPDGARIAYSAVDPAADGPSCAAWEGSFCSSRIFVAAVDGSGARQIGDRILDARGPAWSPDGSTIAFGGGDASVEVRLYLMDADGTDVRQVSAVRGTVWAFVTTDWSHDGTKIVAQAGAAGNVDVWDIWVISADGSSATNVGAHAGGDEILPEWAPDREAIVWAHDQIVLLEEGATAVDLPVSGEPEWSPDGKLLAVANDTALTVMDLDGNVQMTVDGVANGVVWQPLFE